MSEQAQITDDHAVINALVECIREETGRLVPDVARQGPGVRARVLMVFRDPPLRGPGPLATGLMDSTVNRDLTARNMEKLWPLIGLHDHDQVVSWNAVPWDLGDRRGHPNVEDIRRGVVYLRQLVSLLPDLRVVVACGNDAHMACRLARASDTTGLFARIKTIEVCMPSNQGFNSQPGNREKFVAGLRQAAALASEESKP